MRIDKAGAPFIAGALVPAALLAGYKRYGWAAGFAALGAFFAYFFRDPERHVPADDGLVVSPADGKVMIAGPHARQRRDAGERCGWPIGRQRLSVFPVVHLVPRLSGHLTAPVARGAGQRGSRGERLLQMRGNCAPQGRTDC